MNEAQKDLMKALELLEGESVSTLTDRKLDLVLASLRSALAAVQEEEEASYARFYSLVLTYVLGESGEPLVGIHEEGESPLVTKLGMLRMAEDTLLHSMEEEDA